MLSREGWTIADVGEVVEMEEFQGFEITLVLGEQTLTLPADRGAWEYAMQMKRDA
jgi:hypothetical protein